MGRLARPEEIANTIVFLSGNQASYITGTTLTVSAVILELWRLAKSGKVDGGYSIH